MAYGVKYRFPFESVGGVDWTIDILKNGYSGSVNIRHLGGAPTLRKDKNDCICGTSFDIIAECSSDGEFEEFSTSDPFAFQVKAYNGSTLVWQGFISPELYSAPDIAPPYDVRVTATDGLGELKLKNYLPQGQLSLSSLLSYLLDFTGLSLGFRLVSDLSSGGSAWGALTNTYVNIDHLAGETCYDVLQRILATLHLTITQYGDDWLLQKETGMSYNSGSGTVGSYVNGTSKQMGVQAFGSMDTHLLWPVGHMTREYVAPKNSMVVTADNHYREDLLDHWQTSGGASDGGGYWDLPVAGAGITQTVIFRQEVSKYLMLSIKVRNIGDGEDVGNLGVYVMLSGSFYQAGSYLYLAKYSGKRRRIGNDAIWSTDSTSTWDAEVQAPSESDTDRDYVDIDILIPLYDEGIRSYVRASSLYIDIFNGDQLYGKRVYGVSLYQYDQVKGFKKVVVMDNGARGEAPDVDVIFPCTTDFNAYSGLEDLVYGVPVNSQGETLASWSACAFSNLDFLSLIARDYAVSYASPRVRLSGVIQFSGNTIPAMLIDSYDSVLYIIESCSWDLRNDEISVQMISKPSTSSIYVDSETTEEGDEVENPLGHQQSDSAGVGGELPIASATTLGAIKVGSGLSIDGTGVLSATGGGSGGGTVTSVAMTVPTGMTVSGSPITSAGTLALGLSSGRTIPTSADVEKGVTAYGWGNHADAGYAYESESGNYVTLHTTQNNISGEKTFTTKPVHIGATSGLDVNGSSYIDIGDARLKWDGDNHALHVTKRPGSSYSGNISVYADGDVGGGGPGSGSTVNYVNCENQTAYNNISPKDPATLYTVGTAPSFSKIYLGSILIYSS